MCMYGGPPSICALKAGFLEGRVCIFSPFLANVRVCSRVVAPVPLPSSVYVEIPVDPSPRQCLVLPDTSFCQISDIKQYVIVALNCISLVTNGIEYLFMCLCTFVLPFFCSSCSCLFSFKLDLSSRQCIDPLCVL